jgi:hypothetical protein
VPVGDDAKGGYDQYFPRLVRAFDNFEDTGVIQFIIDLDGSLSWKSSIDSTQHYPIG